MSTHALQHARRHIKKIAVALGAAIALPASLVGLRFGYEHAPYNVEKELPSFEVRRYAPRIVAEVAVSSVDAKAASSKGFRILADYIFGNNIANASIAMTTPVDRQESETIAMTTPVDVSGDRSSWTVRFTMPAEYTLDALPTPVDPRITLRPLTSTRVAATRFSGVADDASFKRHYQALRLALNEEGYSVGRDVVPTFAQYDPPWTPGVLRRNEVTVELGN